MAELPTRRQLLKYGLRGFVAAGVGKGVYNTTANQVVLEKVDVKIQNLPKPFKGFKIAVLSDFHASMIANNGLFRQSARLAMSQKPDMIALTGDFVTGQTKFLRGSIGEFNAGYMTQSIDAMAGLSAPEGVFGVLGNHDFWSGPAAVSTIMEAYTRAFGVVWLRNGNKMVSRAGESIHVLGVDDYWQDSSSLSKACKGLETDSVKIVLSHNPDINDEVAPYMKIDLIISGHTHGGQVVLPFIGQPIVPSRFGQKYRAGLVRDGARQTYITGGISYLLAPIRFNCPPEVTVITLV